jgi:predicted phage gp36 major capsid-like protein
MTKPKAKKAATADGDPGDLIAKAQRRGEKLKNTLTRIVTQTELDRGHPAHVLLKALDKSLSKLREHGEAHERPKHGKTAQKAKTVNAETSPAASTKSSSEAKAPRSARTPRTKKDGPGGALKTEDAPALNDTVP